VKEERVKEERVKEEIERRVKNQIRTELRFSFVAKLS